MKALSFTFFFLLSIMSSAAEAQILRTPVDADYVDFLRNADARCNSCELLLTIPDETPRSSSLAYVRAKTAKSGETEIQAAYFKLGTGTDASGKNAVVNDYLASAIAPQRLKDAQASKHFQANALRAIAAHKALAPNATIVVSRADPFDASAKASPIDTSALISFGSAASLIVEQVSEVPQFAANMKWLRERPFSQNVTLFDFTPRSRDAVKQMGVDAPPLFWQHLSRRVSATFRSYGKSDVIGPRTKKALLSRLKDPTGGVVILYAHSDGEKIWLHTDTDVDYLTPDDIKEVGKAAGGRLPPIILLNCETRAALGPQFLAAGSPIVAATDLKLSASAAKNFISQFAKALYVGKQDAIDAYFSAQKIADPSRLHPIVENEAPDRAAKALWSQLTFLSEPPAGSD
ncbi:hypothetical protein GWG65_06375 [Bradyrhizobium sp. CSA207]|uniref:hypothetical protein n=1 Tax=Bradyrhizobium sp. CSA207 TaxID=2698826 RepID=UPI0023B126DF|nr:hypothetical protein [Bradyrhizobium sp. CSA207]MDE5441087.1 hypothetical protein [Bradyrhizobium sp. CSA207]